MAAKFSEDPALDKGDKDINVQSGSGPELTLDNLEEDASCTSEETESSKGPRGPWSEKVIPNSVDGENYVNFNLAPGEYLLQCPYENSHRILPMRMGNHLYRCRRNYAKKLAELGLMDRMIPCPWNPHHIVSEVEIHYHSAQCCDRYKTPEQAKEHLKYAPPPKVHPNFEQPGDEDWDKDPPRFLSYDPKKKLETEPIIYQPKMMSKAEKEKYRDEQRLKFYYQVSGPFWESYSNPRLDKLHGILKEGEGEGDPKPAASSTSSKSSSSASTSAVAAAKVMPAKQKQSTPPGSTGPAVLVDTFTEFSQWGQIRMDEHKAQREKDAKAKENINQKAISKVQPKKLKKNQRQDNNDGT